MEKRCVVACVIVLTIVCPVVITPPTAFSALQPRIHPPCAVSSPLSPSPNTAVIARKLLVIFPRAPCRNCTNKIFAPLENRLSHGINFLVHLITKHQRAATLHPSYSSWTTATTSGDQHRRCRKIINEGKKAKNIALFLLTCQN